MSADSEMKEIRELIAFYDKRGWDWRSAAEYTLGLRSGMDEQRRHWMYDFVMIPKSKLGRPKGEAR